MSEVKLRWATPDIDAEIAYQARVSNPDNQDNPEFARLLNYCMRNGHVSPFEMANMSVQIDTTRDISRQILRHRSFSFQEFSQRYEDATKLGDMVERECRLQDTANRQNSLECNHLPEHIKHFSSLQNQVWKIAESSYHLALSNGIAKEQARALLPEGLTPTRLYMNGNIRSWIFYLKQRLDPTTQKEHRIVAEQVLAVLREVAPVTAAAFFGEEIAKD
ncbi:thymidylate synthase [Acinetobacter phage Aristophanes]|uniref:Thymidylate synthase n=1 Tax=Acinetobacter phage Aristophanes TaxID=2759203 RepID=A0A7G9VYN1_BPACA|nr:thymidylate synthase [Acinetobacter phage Aristophanes]